MNLSHKKEKLERLKKMHEDGELSDALYEKAVKLEKKFRPYIFKRAKNGKIKSVEDIFAGMEKERKAKEVKKKKAAERKAARLKKKK